MMLTEDQKAVITRYISRLESGRHFYCKSLCYWIRRDLAIDVSPQTLRYLLPKMENLEIERKRAHQTLWRVV